jgi:hypothetical protein
MLGFIPLGRKLVRGADNETPVVEGNGLGGLEPGTDRVFW